MPAGVSWPRYLAFTTAAFISMMTGSQLVYIYYRPLMDLNKYINKELEHLPEHVQISIREELRDEGILNESL